MMMHHFMAKEEALKAKSDKERTKLREATSILEKLKSQNDLEVNYLLEKLGKTLADTNSGDNANITLQEKKAASLHEAITKLPQTIT